MKTKVAFICTHNSCRSQMSEAIAKHKYKDKFDFYSAGTHIKNKINDDAVNVIKKIYNIDMNKTQKPKLIDDLPQDIDIVITMGCGVQCPNIKCKHFIDWNLKDPTNQNEQVFIETIKIIENNLDSLVKKYE